MIYFLIILLVLICEIIIYKRIIKLKKKIIKLNYEIEKEKRKIFPNFVYGKLIKNKKD